MQQYSAKIKKQSLQSSFLAFLHVLFLVFEENVTCLWGPERTHGQVVCNNSLTAEPQSVCPVGLKQNCMDLSQSMAADMQDKA